MPPQQEHDLPHQPGQIFGPDPSQGQAPQPNPLPTNQPATDPTVSSPMVPTPQDAQALPPVQAPTFVQQPAVAAQPAAFTPPAAAKPKRIKPVLLILVLLVLLGAGGVAAFFVLQKDTPPGTNNSSSNLPDNSNTSETAPLNDPEAVARQFMKDFQQGNKEAVDGAIGPKLRAQMDAASIGSYYDYCKSTPFCALSLENFDVDSATAAVADGTHQEDGSPVKKVTLENKTTDDSGTSTVSYTYSLAQTDGKWMIEDEAQSIHASSE